MFDYNRSAPGRQMNKKFSNRQAVRLTQRYNKSAQSLSFKPKFRISRLFKAPATVGALTLGAAAALYVNTDTVSFLGTAIHAAEALQNPIPKQDLEIEYTFSMPGLNENADLFTNSSAAFDSSNLQLASLSTNHLSANTPSKREEAPLPFDPLAQPKAEDALASEVKEQLPEELTQAEPAPKQQAEPGHITVSSGDTFYDLALANGLSPKDVYSILKNKTAKKYLSRLKKGDELHFERNGDTLERIVHPLSRVKSLNILVSDKGFKTQVEEAKLERTLQTAVGEIESSLFVSASRAGISQRLIMELTKIFKWDIDFAQDIRPGDQYRFIYEAFYKDGELVKTGNVLAAEFTVRNTTKRAFLYVNSKGKSQGYYSEKGKSLKKAFLRNPLDIVRITSKFNPRRRHPVLNTIRAHKGVDYGASTGTPIRATADGVVVSAGRKGAYGKVVVLKHARSHSTLYAHMSKIAKRSKRGRKIKQGQIIGYVGATGRVTGPHLHYELRKNGKHIDPLKVTTLGSVRLGKASMKRFKPQVNRYIAQLQRAAAKNQLAKK